MKVFIFFGFFLPLISNADTAKWYVFSSGISAVEINLRQIEKGKRFGGKNNSWLCILTPERGAKFSSSKKSPDGFSRSMICSTAAEGPMAVVEVDCIKNVIPKAHARLKLARTASPSGQFDIELTLACLLD